MFEIPERAGATTVYSWRDTKHAVDDYCICKENCGGTSQATQDLTCAVGSKLPNNWGLYDMIGNVWEWCNDWYGGYGYGSATDPTGASSGAYRVIRGGSWNSRARSCRSAYRGRNSPGIRNIILGFRVALAPSH